MCALSGCATQGRYFKLEAALQGSIRTFDGAQYLNLAKVCDTYGLDCKIDKLVNTATIEKGSNRIVLRAGSTAVLVNGPAVRVPLVAASYRANFRS